MPTAVYPGTFDPFHKGHMDIIQRAAKMYDKLIIGVSDHGRKQVLFDIDTRCNAIASATVDIPGVEVRPFTDLLTRFAEREGAHAIIRGLRVTSDFEYEFKMAQFIEDQSAEMEVVYLMATRRTLHISSSSIKELASLKADISGYVTAEVATMIEQAYGYGNAA